ncbi:MAG: hypothetical protein PVSMB9_08960 [Candidatus Dormibacteria bacterium]
MYGSIALRHGIHALGTLTLLGAITAVEAPGVLAAAAVNPIIGPVSIISPCSGQNAEVEQAVDRSNGYIYEEWMGCSGISFARSIDGGLHFSDPISVPGSVGTAVNSWDPALAVAPNGTVYAAFMLARNSDWYPVVAASFDHGVTFPQVTPLLPPDHKNWGDRDFIAVAPNGEVYVTWDYGPNRTSVTFLCSASGSCGFGTGDLNAVFQRSTDGGKSFGLMSYVSPGFPASGGDSAPMVVEPNGRIDVLYQGYQITNTTTYAMNPGHSYFTASTDHGKTWSQPVQLGPDNLTMSLDEWWIDGAIAADADGNLYATWDTQEQITAGVTTHDTGWLSVSTNHGRTWSPLIQVTDTVPATHIVEVTGGGPGVAYIGYLSNSTGAYAQYIRPYSVTQGWLSGPIQMPAPTGASSVWPGDTFGLSTLSSNRVALSWGSAIPVNNQLRSEIFATVVSFPGY